MNSFEVQQVNTPSYLVILSSERPRLSELSNRPLSMVVKIAWGLARPLLRHVLSGGFHSYIPITPILPKANPFIDGKNESGPVLPMPSHGISTKGRSVFVWQSLRKEKQSSSRGCFRFAGLRNKLCVGKIRQSSTNRELASRSLSPRRG